MSQKKVRLKYHFHLGINNHLLITQSQTIHVYIDEAILWLLQVSQGSLYCFLGSIPIVTESKFVKFCLNDKKKYVGKALIVLTLICIDSLTKAQSTRNP